MTTRVLLGQLNSNGDCLFATVIARQIKEIDYPGCHLTWAVNSRCRQTIENNPYVDEIWEIPTEETLASLDEWNSFVADAETRRKNGDFDQIFLTQIIGENLLNFDGGIRSSIYNSYPHPITVPFDPVLRLTDAEIANVGDFVEHHGLCDRNLVILIECGPASFDSSLDQAAALQLAAELTAANKNIAVILSSNRSFDSERKNIIDASVLTFRENAELTKYCDLFIGCGSGITWLTTSDEARRLDTVLVISENHNVLPSMIYDHENVGLPTERIIEICSGPAAIDRLRQCLDTVINVGFAEARSKFNENMRPRNLWFVDHQIRTTLSRLAFGQLVSCLSRIAKRNGIGFFFTARFAGTVAQLIVKGVKKLPAMIAPSKVSGHS